MKTTYRKMKNLFLRQSYLDSWEDYRRSLRKQSFIKWDYIILTASNEEQAKDYREQIEDRLRLGFLPASTKYAVLPDPDGKRVGSGGATFHVMKYIAEQDEEGGTDHFAGKRILVIHSGGDSKRVPQYSACGKLFSPVPRELPDGRPSTLFDEFMIAMSGVAGRIPEGMLVLSGDVLLLFNPLQIDFQSNEAAAISIKEHVSIGKDHGVFLNDGKDYVKSFLHKKTEGYLTEVGAVNKEGNVDLDTGAIILGSKILDALYSLISTNGCVDMEKYSKYVNEQARVSFYGDFLYPLAGDSTLEQYYREAAEGTLCTELMECRKELWEVLHPYRLRLLCLSPSEFIHFGTTKELHKLVTSGVDNYEFLDWKRLVLTNYENSGSCAVYNSLIEEHACIEEDVYIENSMIGSGCVIHQGSVISEINVENCEVPERTTLHGLALDDGRFVARIYGVEDNPKGTYESSASFLNTNLKTFVDEQGIPVEKIWDEGTEKCLWFAKLYPICATMKEAVKEALRICRIASGQASEDEIKQWLSQERMSLYESFNHAAPGEGLKWNQKLRNRILVRKFMKNLKDGLYYRDAFSVFGESGINVKQYRLLMQMAEELPLEMKTKIYYALSREMKHSKLIFDGNAYDFVESKCFGAIADVIFESGSERLRDSGQYRIVKECVDVRLPVRVNWGGGWTDTPPQCNELGGTVLNAAISLRGKLPIHVVAKKIDKLHIEFASTDTGAEGSAETAAEIQNCHNPYDPFALHKAALIACGIIPLSGVCDLQERLKELGGGIYLSTEVENVPKGSGLGTSSILSGACVKALNELLGNEVSEDALFDTVLTMEQIMSTGGGWQDQVGGLTNGIKFINSKPGIRQKLQVEKVQLEEATLKELNQRFALIYTGQRRLARNLLRDVIGSYIGNRPETLYALKNMKKTAALMKFELERGNVDSFAELLNEHWELSKTLDAGTTNTCIDQIFLSCEDLIQGKFIAGAGGGGFLQVILKKGVTKERLHQRLQAVWQDSGVDVWDCEIL
ncbi:L-fucokinase [Ruminococcus sp. 5_1_39BFAA]|uniref:fucose pyrophosphorylase domain-containing protein n=1 Tax=Ruminococcus sp. 5_1_39BFAA TaxID=457412 RepID=UPI003569EEB1